MGEWVFFSLLLFFVLIQLLTKLVQMTKTKVSRLSQLLKTKTIENSSRSPNYTQSILIYNYKKDLLENVAHPWSSKHHSKQSTVS